MDADSHISAFILILLVGLFSLPVLTSETERNETYTPYTISGHEKLEVDITFYTSRIQETDSTPFITADGSRVKKGVIAISHDLFEYFDYGDSIYVDGFGWFEVRDCMNRRWNKRVDIWVDDYHYAIENGIQQGFIRWGYWEERRYRVEQIEQVEQTKVNS